MADERGSARMLRERLGGTGIISDADLALIADLSDAEDINLVRWWWKGQPAIDVVVGAFQTPIDRASEVVSTLLQTEAGLHLDVFPVGLPRPDRVMIGFRSQNG